MNLVWHLLDDFVWRGLSLLLVVAYLVHLHRRVREFDRLQYCLKRRLDVQSVTLEIHTDHLASNSSEIGKLDRRVESQARYLRMSVKDGIAWGAGQERRTGTLEREFVDQPTVTRLIGEQIEFLVAHFSKLDKVAHSHEEMHPLKNVRARIDGRDIPRT